MRNALLRTSVLTLGLAMLACGPAGPPRGPGGVHEGDYLSAQLETGRIEGTVSGWSGKRWIEIHRTGDLVQRLDVDRLATFKVRCSHE